MDKFVLITNAYKDKGLNISNKIVSYIQAKGGRADICVTNTEDEKKDFSLEEIPKDTECILVLGGDGTLIRVATRVERLEIPLIGVNLGTLGYLCELEEATVYEAIDKLMENQFVIEERMMLSAGRGEGDAKSYLALNDVALHWMGELTLLHLLVYVNGELLNTYHADGILVATPTGSTGYNMSAGGPIVEPRARMLLMTPINAHNINSQSIVFGKDDVIEIQVGDRPYLKEVQVGVSFDGDTSLKLGVGDKLRIERADRTIKICKINRQSFLEILSKKMIG